MTLKEMDDSGAQAVLAPAETNEPSVLPIWPRDCFPSSANRLTDNGAFFPKFESVLVPSSRAETADVIELLQRWIDEDGGALSPTFNQDESEFLQNRMVLRAS
ncbi:MAG: hypothetical protein JO366_08845 [Methylobacteriaceae bacterium]|nr:hypothetical protein [Methylobacteriaceae bacterium]MBV9244906.1 hypothetical protein [Methylobacteriaceae bacterium]